MRVLKEKYDVPEFMQKIMNRELGQNRYIKFSKQEIEVLKKAEIILRAATDVYDEDDSIEPDGMIYMAWTGLHQIVGED